jgi:hypothetical protein
LDKLNKDKREKMVFIWWRSWQHQNNIIFDKGDVYVDNSIRYLQNYLATLQDIANGDGNVDRKGKRITMQAPEDRCLGHPQGKKRKKLGGDQNKAGLNATWMQASQLIANVEPGEQ